MVTRRLNRIFQSDGRALIVACDHGMISGPDRGIENMEHTLTQVLAGGVDAVMASYGTAIRFAKKLAHVGLVLRMDGAGTVLGAMDGPGAQFYTVEDALRLGADALCVTAFPGSRHEEATLEVLAQVIRQAHAWGLPVMAEMVPGGFDSGPAFRTLDSISVSARVAAELGADWVKIPYVDGFESVVKSCYVPVVVLGGPHQDHPQTTLKMVKAGMLAGAVGATIGRNIWQAERPARMAAAIASIIHQGATVDEALEILSRPDE
jgi:class I fructose-bisphosphate aldolase/fructose-bisphosphate aldolase/2-amino-3,7-dideoxy-D-threo-hept-6-ulosonate synthase